MNLSGPWLLTLPRGFEYDATLEKADAGGRYLLRCGATNFRGVYELRDGCLSVVDPENAQMNGLVWEVKNRNVLLLTEQPPESSVGADYRNATLSRQRPADEPGPARRGLVNGRASDAHPR